MTNNMNFIFCNRLYIQYSHFGKVFPPKNIQNTFLLTHFSFWNLGSRPSMADKILRRTSYGGEQTENISKILSNSMLVTHNLYLLCSSHYSNKSSNQWKNSQFWAQIVYEDGSFLQAKSYETYIQIPPSTAGFW